MAPVVYDPPHCDKVVSTLNVDRGYVALDRLKCLAPSFTTLLLSPRGAVGNHLFSCLALDWQRKPCLDPDNNFSAVG